MARDLLADARLAALLDAEGSAHIYEKDGRWRPAVSFRQTSSDPLLYEVARAMGTRPKLDHGSSEVRSASQIIRLLDRVLPWTSAHFEQFQLVREFARRVEQGGGRRLSAADVRWRRRAQNRVRSLNAKPRPGRELAFASREMALSGAGGLLDGEGHISVGGLAAFAASGYDLRLLAEMMPRVAVKSTCRQLVVMLERILRGGTPDERAARPGRRPMWEWVVSSPLPVHGVLTDVLPYLKAKHAEADAVRRYAGLILADNASHHQRVRRPAESLEARAAVLAELRHAKGAVEATRARYRRPSAPSP